MTLKRYWILGEFLFFLLALDVVSKLAALAWIPPMQWGELYPFGGIPIFSFGMTCSLNMAINTGAAWGLFPGHSGLLFALRALIIGGLIVYLTYRREWKLPLWVIVIGAIGNAIDYCLYGYVIDFIHVTFWGRTFPIFNLADSYITIGAIWLFLSSKKYGNPRLHPQE